jgi:hypothetical protein
MKFDCTVWILSALSLIVVQEPIFSYVERTFHFIAGKKRKISHD